MTEKRKIAEYFGENLDILTTYIFSITLTNFWIYFQTIYAGLPRQVFYITFEFWLAFSLPGLAGAIIMAPTSSKFEYYMQEIITNLSLELKAGFFWLFWENLKKFFQLCLPFYRSSSPSLQNLCCCLAVLRGRSWLVSCPHGVNLLTNQLRPLKKSQTTTTKVLWQQQTEQNKYEISSQILEGNW